jgi:hypothetical protein
MKHTTAPTKARLQRPLACQRPHTVALQHTPRKWGLALAAVAGLWLTGCIEMLRSDNTNLAHRSSQARQAALVGNQAASRQAAPAQPVQGDALVQLLSGKSHISEFRKQVEDSQPYFVSYSHFQVGGGFVAADTYGHRSPDYYRHGQWRVNGPLLCVTGLNGNALEPSGAVQYWIHKPGDAFHGLITSRVHLVREGQQVPAFTSTPAQMR